jgi:two-component system, OmpR family, response regulator VanR
MKILLVEDDDVNAYRIIREMKNLNYDIDIASDGIEGLDKALGKAYDLILLKDELPSIEGYEICRIIKKYKNDPVIIILRTSDSEDDWQKALLNGADILIESTFSVSAIYEKVASIKSDKKLSFEIS